MRRQLRHRLPELSAFYQLKPWELAGGPAELTFGELNEFLGQMPDIELRRALSVAALPNGA